MGYGSYSASDWAKLKQSKSLSQNQEVREVFRKPSCDPKYDPKFIGTRECFDSEDHPHSTPIVVGLDVTASMGYLAVKVASEALNDLIMKLYSTGAVEDPALMCAAYGDWQDESPLQITQFESDIRIAEQLLELYFENGGTGEVVLPCLWAFLSRHTNIDAIKKRGQKGFLFTIGDDATIRDGYVRETVLRVIGDNIEGASRKGLLEEVQKSFHVFHIMIGREGNKDILHGHKIVLDKSDIDIIPDVIIGTIRMQKGESLSALLSECDSIKAPLLNNALGQLSLTGPDGMISL